MGWIKRGSESRHKCPVPEVEPDAIWECDDCGTRWVSEAVGKSYDPVTSKAEPFGWFWERK